MHSAKLRLLHLNQLPRFANRLEFERSKEDAWVRLQEGRPAQAARPFMLRLIGDGSPGDLLCAATELRFPAVDWYRVSDVTVLFPYHLMWNRDGRRADDLTIYRGDPPRHYQHEEPIGLCGEHYMCTNNNFLNYAHWHVECLTSFDWARTLDWSPRRCVLPGLGLSYQQDSTQALAWNIRAGTQIHSGAVRFEKLNFLSTCDHLRPDDVTWPVSLPPIAAKLKAWAGLTGEEAGLRRLFISRRRAARRPCTNEAEIARALVDLDFEVIEPETMSYATQIATFADAAVVVGMHGAGLTNMMFCRPGTLLVEAQPAAYASSFFLRLSALFGMRHCIWRQAGDASRPPHAPWQIDAAGFVRFVADAIAAAEAVPTATE
jgi:Glycosyltransferase 61